MYRNSTNNIIIATKTNERARSHQRRPLRQRAHRAERGARADVCIYLSLSLYTYIYIYV